MGKCIKKGKSRTTTPDGSITEVSPCSSMTAGVRTRAKTPVLRRLQNPSFTSSASSSYLQLRSRRLEKRQTLIKTRNQTQSAKQSCGGESSNFSKRDHGLSGETSTECEDSCGRNNLEFEGRERSMRESTPCSSTGDINTVEIPGPTERKTSSCSWRTARLKTSTDTSFMTEHEMEEFFSFAEQQQQRLFIKKYNFDISSDSPLPGRYEWVQVHL